MVVSRKERKDPFGSYNYVLNYNLTGKVPIELLERVKRRRTEVMY